MVVLTSKAEHLSLKEAPSARASCRSCLTPCNAHSCDSHCDCSSWERTGAACDNPGREKVEMGNGGESTHSQLLCSCPQLCISSLQRETTNKYYLITCPSLLFSLPLSTQFASNPFSIPPPLSLVFPLVIILFTD